MRYEMREDDHTQPILSKVGHVQNIYEIVNLKNIKYKLRVPI